MDSVRAVVEECRPAWRSSWGERGRGAPRGGGPRRRHPAQGLRRARARLPRPGRPVLGPSVRARGAQPRRRSPRPAARRETAAQQSAGRARGGAPARPPHRVAGRCRGRAPSVRHATRRPAHLAGPAEPRPAEPGAVLAAQVLDEDPPGLEADPGVFPRDEGSSSRVEADAPRPRTPGRRRRRRPASGPARASSSGQASASSPRSAASRTERASAAVPGSSHPATIRAPSTVARLPRPKEPPLPRAKAPPGRPGFRRGEPSMTTPGASAAETRTEGRTSRSTPAGAGSPGAAPRGGGGWRERPRRLPPREERPGVDGGLRPGAPHGPAVGAEPDRPLVGAEDLGARLPPALHRLGVGEAVAVARRRP